MFLGKNRNNYTMFAVTYAIPLITDRDYGYGQLENSYIYLALTITSLCSTSVVRFHTSQPLSVISRSHLVAMG